MRQGLLWLLLMAPGALMLMSAFPNTVAEERGQWTGRAGCWLSFVALGITVVAAVSVALVGPMHTATLGVGGVGFAVYLDSLSALVAVLVAFVGSAVIRYAATYMTGDPRYGQFMRYLCLTLAAVLILIIAGNLFQLALAWVATSVALNRLLLFYPHRVAAILAARKKFVASRLGDACLVTAMALIYRNLGSLDYTQIVAHTQSLWQRSGGPLVPLFLAITALLKSAQFPVHGWLTEVMETPTPVSALLHAGVINAGGFLLLRFASLLALSSASLHTLALAGALTALFGSTVMLTQSGIKSALAYSTIAQMGFMMLEIGLGVFSAALLHIVAHSLYKAHAFLSSGSIIDLARASWSPSPGGNPHPARILIAIVSVMVVAGGIATFFGITIISQPGVLTLGTILLIGLVHLLANAIDERPSLYVLVRALGLAALVAATYFVLQLGAERLLMGSLPPNQPLHGPLDLTIIISVLIGFGAVTVLQNVLPRHAQNRRWRALYVHLSNGLYVNALTNRWVLRYWPRSFSATARVTGFGAPP